MVTVTAASPAIVRETLSFVSDHLEDIAALGDVSPDVVADMVISWAAECAREWGVAAPERAA